MSKLRALAVSLWFWTVAPAVIGLGFLVVRSRPLEGARSTFDALDGCAFAMLIFGTLWLIFYSVEYDAYRSGKAARLAPSEGDTGAVSEDVARLNAEVAARIKEVADFKAALERKNEEIRGLRSTLNRADLKAVNEGIAEFLFLLFFTEVATIRHGCRPLRAAVTGHVGGIGGKTTLGQVSHPTIAGHWHIERHFGRGAGTMHEQYRNGFGRRR